jgi:oligopeptide transport system ATP-binding protein
VSEQPHPRAPLLEVRDLCKSFHVRESPDLVAVDMVSFGLEAGSSLAIVGESGAGKTTIARILVGLERQSSGTVLVAGRERAATRVGAAERLRRAREIQIVFQDPYLSLDRRQRVGDCIGEILRLRFGGSKRERATRIGELLDQVGLDPRHAASRPRALSGGERQRVAIARALAVQPAILILDEAVSALDVSIQAQVLNLLADIRRDTGMAYLLISHDLAVVRQLADDVLVMRKGKVLETGSSAQVLRSPRHPYTRLLRESVPREGWQPQAVLGRRESEAAPGALLSAPQRSGKRSRTAGWRRWWR